MKPKTQELGKLLVDSGDVVCFSLDNVDRLAERLGLSTDEVLRRYEGVACQLNEDGVYGVDTATAVRTDGGTHSVVVIGADENFLRLLGADEPTLREFLQAHPRYGELGKGDSFNEQVFKELVAEYKAKLLG